MVVTKCPEFILAE